MAVAGILPRFFKVFISHFCSESMMIPSSYNDELPLHLPKTAVLYGTGGCFWNVEMMRKREDVYFGQGWSKFVEDNILKDGDVLTFVYDGDRSFEVSVYGHKGCKETRMKAEEVIDDLEDSSETNTSSEPELVTPVPKGKSIVVVEDSEEDSYNDSIYSPPPVIEDITMERIAADSKKKRESKSARDVEDMGNASSSKRTRKIVPKIKHPQAYLSNLNNPHFETQLMTRPYELLIHARDVKDYGLNFEEHINYEDKYGKLSAKTLRWNSNRVCISNWHRICNRNKVKKEDRILCELIRNKNVVYEIKVHIVREKDL